MDENCTHLIEQSENFTIIDYSNHSQQNNMNQIYQEYIDKINYLQIELNQTKTNYQKLFKEFQLYNNKCQELFLKQNEYIFQENWQLSELQHQIKVLTTENNQLIEETLRVQNLNKELLNSINCEKEQLQKLKSEKDQLTQNYQNQRDSIAQFIKQNQDNERQNQDLKNQIESLVNELDSIKQEYYLTQKNKKKDVYQQIITYLQDIAQIIIEELNLIEQKYKEENDQLQERKQLVLNLNKIFKENLLNPLKNHHFILRHEFQDNKCLGFDELYQKKIQ